MVKRAGREVLRLVFRSFELRGRTAAIPPLLTFGPAIAFRPSDAVTRSGRRAAYLASKVATSTIPSTSAPLEAQRLDIATHVSLLSASPVTLAVIASLGTAKPATVSSLCGTARASSRPPAATPSFEFFFPVFCQVLPPLCSDGAVTRSSVYRLKCPILHAWLYVRGAWHLIKRVLTKDSPLNSPFLAITPLTTV
jgi:hypothetical protein